MKTSSVPAATAHRRPPIRPPAPPGLGIYSTRVQLILFSMLLMATPFIMLRVFLQQAIASLSDLHFSIAGFELPMILTLVCGAAVALAAWQWRKVTKRVIAAALIVIAMDALAQQITDYYSAHRFYDLQQNWHYLAYGLFAFMMYRDLEPRGVPLARIFLLTFGCALCFSIIDEAFQKYINTRIFDISDIAKDAYGAVAGCIIVGLSGRHGAELVQNWRLRHPVIRDYFRHPFSALALIFVFAFSLLTTGSLLSDDPLFLLAMGTAVVIAGLVFLVMHASQFRVGKAVLLGLLVLGGVAQATAYLHYRDEGVVYSGYGLTVYKGIPIPLFDVMIRPSGGFRLVDKKHDFNYRDRMFFLKKQPDILMISSGTKNEGGNGFPSKKATQYMFNPFSGRGTQVMILPNEGARQTYNRLRKEGKNVLFILHSTC